MIREDTKSAGETGTYPWGSSDIVESGSLVPTGQSIRLVATDNGNVIHKHTAAIARSP